MRHFKQQKIAVLLVAIATGACTSVCLGAPAAHGAASAGASVRTSGAAAGGGINTSTSTGSTGVGTSATGNAGTTGQNTGVSTGAGATGQNTGVSAGAGAGTTGPAANENNTTGTTSIPATGQATQPGVAPLTGGAALTGSTGGANQQFPVYTGTTTGPTVQSFSASATTPPQIIGTVSGTGGKLYYISADGYMYYRNGDGQYVSFGRLTAPNQNVITPGGTTFGVAGTTTTSTGLTVPQSRTQVPNQGNIRVMTNAQGVVVGGSASNAFANGGTANANDNDADDVRRRRQLSNGTNTFVNDNDADDVRRRHDRDRDRDRDRQSSTNNQNLNFQQFQPTITGTVVGNNGQSYYLASNGMIYYRGQDGNLHVFGSGVPQ